MPGAKKFIIIDPADNVATAIFDLDAGEEMVVGDHRIPLLKVIPFGHKFALEEIPLGEYVIKYGARIGRATHPILEGDHVHVHNVEDIVDEVRKNYGS